jgi:putative transposase
MLTRLEEIFKHTYEKWECELKEFNGEPDPVHLLIDINPKVQISTFANNLKTVSSRLIRKEFSFLVREILRETCLLENRLLCSFYWRCKYRNY